MRIEEFNFPSADHETEIHAVRWLPDGEVKAILQISHGMVEHIGRYSEFARYLTEQGVLVTGNDHLGHGRSVTGPEELAHFPKKGNRTLLTDIHVLRSITASAYPDVPYYMLGHSMGSFLVRQYLCLQGTGLSGAIIMGTGHMPGFLLHLARLIARVKILVQGEKHHSKMLTKMTLGAYNRKVKNPVSSNAWLSRDDEQVKRYDADPLCGMLFTNRAFAEMFTSMLYTGGTVHLKRMPKKLPVLFVSGDADPVGGYGKQVAAAAKLFIKLGMENVTVKLYPEARHEILNELNKEEVYQDLAAWMQVL